MSHPLREEQGGDLNTETCLLLFSRYLHDYADIPTLEGLQTAWGGRQGGCSSTAQIHLPAHTLGAPTGDNPSFATGEALWRLNVYFHLKCFFKILSALQTVGFYFVLTLTRCRQAL